MNPAPFVGAGYLLHCLKKERGAPTTIQFCSSGIFLKILSLAYSPLLYAYVNHWIMYVWMFLFGCMIWSSYVRSVVGARSHASAWSPTNCSIAAAVCDPRVGLMETRQPVHVLCLQPPA